jgi:quinol-cytochrome oxidoreductase complex cytochrome b subunit
MNRRSRQPYRGVLVELLSWVGITGLFYGPLDRRLSLRDGLDSAFHRQVPRISWWGCFGGISFFLFALLAFSGVILMFFYVPNDPVAHSSIRMIMGSVPFGWFIRTIHHWSANLIMVALMIHTLRVFITGAYRRPRDLNWVVGTGLFGAATAFFLTGHLLPWNQEAYWTAVFWTDLAAQVPFIGGWLSGFLRGGELVTGATLARFYALHVAVLPAAMAALLLVHFIIIRRLGISEEL